jgi:hypothetical protein
MYWSGTRDGVLEIVGVLYDAAIDSGGSSNCFVSAAICAHVGITATISLKE